MDKKKLLDIIDKNLGNDVSINDVKKELENYICLLTRKNADLVEAYIKKDPKYPDDMADIIRKFGIFKNNSSSSQIYSVMNEDNLNLFVWQVAISNSIQGKTHTAKQHITDFILSLGVNFYDRLKDEKTKFELVQKMDSYVYEKSGYKRHECSWCSKICKYLNEYLYDGDGYYIYDNNVKNRLNNYRKSNGLHNTIKKTINSGDPNWYVNFCNSLDELRRKINEKEFPNLTRTEIDHIMWGYQKYPVELVRIK